MRMKNDPVPSVRKRLLALLLLPAVAVLVAGTLGDYFTATAPFSEAYDQALIDTAIALAGRVAPRSDGQPTLVLPPDAAAILRRDKIDSIYFRVSGPGGSLIYGDADLPDNLKALVKVLLQNLLEARKAA